MDNSLTIEEVKEKRRQIEKQIESLIMQYEKETMTYVTDVKLFIMDDLKSITLTAIV